MVTIWFFILKALGRLFGAVNRMRGRPDDADVAIGMEERLQVGC